MSRMVPWQRVRCRVGCDMYDDDEEDGGQDPGVYYDSK